MPSLLFWGISVGVGGLGCFGGGGGHEGGFVGSDGQSHVLGDLLDLGALVAVDSDLEEIQILAMNLQTLHISQDGVDLPVLHSAEAGLLKLATGGNSVDFGGVLEEELGKLLISLHN